jgi:membrane protein implicated in regulation of membrane protease activity
VLDFFYLVASILYWYTLLQSISVSSRSRATTSAASTLFAIAAASVDVVSVLVCVLKLQVVKLQLLVLTIVLLLLYYYLCYYCHTVQANSESNQRVQKRAEKTAELEHATLKDLLKRKQGYPPLWSVGSTACLVPASWMSMWREWHSDRTEALPK